MTRLKQWLTDAERNEKFVAQEELFKLEMEMHEKKLKMQAELCVSKKNPETMECETSDIRVAKLPKLVITSNGSKPTLVHTRPCKIPSHSAHW